MTGHVSAIRYILKMGTEGTAKLQSRRRTGWRIMLACLAIVVLSFVLIRPEWAARLTATALLLGFATIAMLVYGFNPKSEFLHHKSKIARCGSERTKRIARRVIRCLTIIWTAFILIVWTFPVVRDFVDIVIHGRSHLVEVTGRVRSNEFIFGLYFVNQDLFIIKQGERFGRDYQATFFPRLARVGKTYTFVVAPRSGMVLDWTNAE
jgi:hypothetical protein